MIAVTSCTPEAPIAELSLSLSKSEACRPRVPFDSVTVEALGDFPPSDTDTIEVLRPSQEPGIVERFPSDTKELTVRAVASAWLGAGVTTPGQPGRTLILPFDTSCLISDPAVRLPQNARAVLQSNMVLMTSGRSLIFFEPGELAQIRQVLGANREDASASPLSASQSLIAGGRDELGQGIATADIVSGTQVQTRTLLSARYRHAAVQMGSGTVALVGGRENETQLRSDFELFGARNQLLGYPVPRDLPVAASFVGTEQALVAGGFSVAGERLADGELIGVGGPPSSVVLPPVVSMVSLQGRRVAALTQDLDVLVLSLRSGSVLSHRVELQPLPPILASPSLTVLNDGHLLLTGILDGGAVAFEIDLRDESLNEVDANIAPQQSVLLSDGSLLSLSPQGGSLRRTDLVTPFSNPQATTLPTDLDYDLSEWQTQGGSLVATSEDSIATLAILRFADFAFSTNSDTTITLTAGEQHFSLGQGQPCNSTDLAFERRGKELRFSDGTTCELPFEDSHVSLSFSVSKGQSLSLMQMRRL